MASKSILEYFPYPTMRDSQREILLAIEKHWNNVDVFVVVAPTAFGKSATLKAIGQWAGNTSICTPTNLLVDQFSREFETDPDRGWMDGPPIHKLMKRELYPCPRFGTGAGGKPLMTCEAAKAKYGKKLGCSKECAYVQDNRRARGRGVGIYNYYTYMAHKLFRPTLILDEAHNAIKTIQDLSSAKIWRHDYQYPYDMWSYSDIARWLENYEETWGELPDVLQGLKSEITTTAPRYVIKRDRELWAQTATPEERPLLKMLPIDVRDSMPFLWPSKVKKIVMLSATISSIDMETLGLDKRRIMYLEADSPIPVDRRPVYKDYVATANRNNLVEATEIMAKRIIEYYLPKYAGQKGFIHATYAQAKILRSLLPNEDGRFLFHDKTNTRQVFDQFIQSPAESGRVMVASGLYEGVDLADDLGRWQLILKIPYPSLGDPAIRYKAEQSQQWFCWETLRSVLQAAGRICRNENDKGETFILDGSFERLYKQGKDFDLIPSYFDMALVT
jgi:Rad3-related DNA helicase